MAAKFFLAALIVSTLCFHFWSPPHVFSAATPLSNLTATASNTVAGSSPTLALDNNLGTGWASGTTAPQWILLDLGQTTSINQIVLTPSQSPSGRTIHVIKGGSSPTSLRPIITLDQITSNNQTIHVSLIKPEPDIRYLKIETTHSPSWVSWNEIKVYSGTTKVLSNLQYFGYMSNDYLYQTPTYFAELDNLGNSNIAWGINNLPLFKQHNLKVLYPIGFFFRDQTTSPPGRFKLMPNWQEYFANERTKIDPYLDNIYGFYLDEPFWNGATREEFYTFSRAIRNAYPDKALMIYEAAPSINGSRWESSIPLDYYHHVTDLGFDYYFTLDSQNNFDGWGKYLEYFQKFKPHLANKNLWFAPDGFGPPNYASRWSDAYERYLSLAQTTPNTIGMLGFIYNLPSELRAGNIGLSDILSSTGPHYDSSFRARQIEIGQSIINAGSPSPNPHPGDINGDGSVNLLDFNLLIANFGNPYTLLDFNAIIGNYGR